MNATKSDYKTVEAPGIDEINYKIIAEWLYDILDDIDSANDMAKENDKSYRKTVHRLQKLKNEVGRSLDGQTVEFRNPQQEYGFTRIFSKCEITNWGRDNK